MRAFSGFLQHQRPEFIQLQHRVFDFRKRRGEGGQLRYLFLIQSVTVLRETPKVRDSPRKLLRSS